MKKLHLLIIVALFSAFVISCKKDDEVIVPVDNRAEWVGHYKGNSQGQITIQLGDQTSTQPVDGAIEFDIEKGSSTDKIIMTDDSGETVIGTVNGNNVTFAEMTTNETQDGVVMSLSNKMTATFSGTTCTINMTITGTANYLGINMPVTGSVTSIANKQ